MENVEIPRRTTKCCKNFEEFTSGSDYVSLLKKVKKGGFERFDYCLNCWEELTELKDKIFWRSSIPPKKEKKEENKNLIVKAFSFLEDYQKDSKADLAIQAFFFAELLVRFKHLKLCQEVTEENGQIKLIYEVLADGRVFIVEKVDAAKLTKEEIEKIKLDDERTSG